MPQLVMVAGTNKLFSQLEMKNKGWERGAVRGLKKAAAHLMREAQLIVPIDTGHLRGSAATHVMGRGWNTIIDIGYWGVEYSVYVHEDLTKRHGAVFNTYYAAEIAAGREHRRRPAEQAKFLEMPMIRDQAFMRRIIRNEARK